jgi:hypothetical protein
MSVHPPAVVPDEHLIGDIEQFVHEALVDLAPDGLEARRPGPGRPRVLPSLCLWAGLLVGVLRGFSSQLSVWRLLSQHGLWSYPRFPVTDQALYARLERDGTAPLERLFAQISALLAARLAAYADRTLAPFATAVLALDATALAPVARLLPALRGAAPRDDALLPGKLAGVFDLRRQQWVRLWHVADPHENDKVMARRLLEAAPAGALLLADLGYFGFAWFDDLTDRGYHWVARLRAKTSYTLVHTFYQQGETLDALIWLGAHKADRAAHAVRLVQFRVGDTLHRYLTNVDDPQRLPPAEVARLYARRWDIELAFKLIKRHLHLHLLWSSKPVVVLQQVWAVLIVSQILQALRLEIAGHAGVEPFDVSMELLVREGLFLAARGDDPVAAFVSYGRAARLIRPSTRTQIVAPPVPDPIAWPPPNLVRWRTPRYAQRKCGPRPPAPHRPSSRAHSRA